MRPIVTGTALGERDHRSLVKFSANFTSCLNTPKRKECLGSDRYYGCCHKNNEPAAFDLDTQLASKKRSNNACAAKGNQFQRSL